MSNNLEVCCDPDCEWFQVWPNYPSEPMFVVRCLQIPNSDEKRFVFAGSVEEYNADSDKILSRSKNYACLAPDFKRYKSC